MAGPTPQNKHEPLGRCLSHSNPWIEGRDLPLSKRLGWIGVDVGTHTVKLAQAVRTPSGVRLHRAAVIQRTSDWSGDDALARDQPSSSQAEIRAALECGGFSGRDAVCVPPMNVCQLRGLNVPPGSDQERRTIIGDELGEEWAERRGQMEFDFWELEAGKADKSTDVFNVNVLATSRPWVLQLASRLPAGGAGLLGDRRGAAGDGAGGGAGGRLRPAGGGCWPSIGDIRIRRCASWATIGRCTRGGFTIVRFGKVLDSIIHVFGVTLDEAQHLVDTQGVIAPEEASPHLSPIRGTSRRGWSTSGRRRRSLTRRKIRSTSWFSKSAARCSSWTRSAATCIRPRSG